MTNQAWRGDRYLERVGEPIARTYDEARARTHALAPRSWAHYLEIAAKHLLPTGPQLLWPEEWEAGGRYAGYLGTVARGIEQRDGDLVSGLQVRELLGIGRRTWRLLSDDLEPDVVTGHKSYYKPDRVRRHVSANIGRLKKCDSIANITVALRKL